MALAIDTNIFVYALNSDSDVHERARSFVLDAAGVCSFATRNVEDFADLGLFQTFDPLQ